MRKSLKIFLLVLTGLPVLLVLGLFVTGAVLYKTADFGEPDISVDLKDYSLNVDSDTLRRCDQGHRLLNAYGVWECKIIGGPVGRGAAYGVMNQDLIHYQENVFVEQIHRMIPSELWVNFLHKLIFIFNRRMAAHIPEEYREEIYAMALSASGDYGAYGSPYVRQLNYHAAHDIGHAMQEYMLVGCSAFAVWQTGSIDGGLLIGRNFDFYVGDEFARNKMILFVEPENGYRFASVTWPGMMGVVSGMNEKGLTVTINAAKGAIPLRSAMPVSLLARHILQHAANIEDACRLAQQFETFVSESILVGAAEDGCAVVIEKTPEKMGVYRPSGNHLVCTNHYQSACFAEDKYNVENIRCSDSPYRYRRLQTLLQTAGPLDARKAVGILRDRKGIDNQDIGLTNEKSLNQFVAHHSVVFQPEDLRMWVSTSPWQLGTYVCYDLHQVFAGNCRVASYVVDTCCIGADSLALHEDYPRVCLYRTQRDAFRAAIENGVRLPDTAIRRFIDNNPCYFQVYNVLGDYMLAQGDKAEAVRYWQKALSLEIPRESEREELRKKAF